ncbi:hypothetical protein CDD82_4068 [Ophiocordyceps australis]|uniref:Zn(2)-C6 fungal-type domain-containing protein n=1 Tax=Ophiocordyceps australis TaxID=1399860 RepID=A0A2C5Z8B1_9HYPO|nr:hypothetical protein CDD82_4068 [Ophiocordyceps australis]
MTASSPTGPSSPLPPAPFASATDQPPSLAGDGKPASPELSENTPSQSPDKNAHHRHQDDETLHQHHQRTAAHLYASNGLEILQAASDAAQALQNHHIQNPQVQALQDAAAAAEAAVQPGVDMPPPPPVHPPQPQIQQHEPAQHHVNHSDMHAQFHQLQQHLQPQPQQHLNPQHQHPPQHQQISPSPRASGIRDPTINPKLTRLRRACDMCSMRKVKCDDSNIPCRPCQELGVDCTYERETKRRGPPNKHAEAAKAAKRARVDLPAASVPISVAASSPSPSPHTSAAKTLIHISSDAATLDAEAIAPLPVLEFLVDDFFTYVHPLAPFPHEPTFRQSFANREDRSRPEFLGLLASMIAALVASFPRAAREYLKSQYTTHHFPKAIVMVERCRDIALATRGNRWVLKQSKTLDDAATSYFLGLASGYIGQWNTSHHFMAETLTQIRELGFTKPQHPGELPTFGSDAHNGDTLPFNHVKDQTGKRIFWCLLLGVRSFSQLGASHVDVVIAPATPSLPYPAYPENVDDICVVANEIIHPAEGSVTLLTGFRFAIDVYTTMNGVVSLELAYGMSTLPWADQRLLLRDGLVAAKGIIDNLPPELQLRNHGDESNSLAALDQAGLQYVPSLWPAPQPAHDVRSVIKSQQLRRRQLQYEIQKANIHVSQLATRSYFLELYFSLREVYLGEQQQQQEQQQEQQQQQEQKQGEQQQRPSEQHQAEQKPELDANGSVDGGEQQQHDLPDAPDKEVLDFMLQERQLLVQDLLSIAGSISQRNLEPHGAPLMHKLRLVAATLLGDSAERNRYPFATKTDEALTQLVEVLQRLDKTGPAAESRATDSSYMTAEDEDEESLHWAELREWQLRHAANGGLAGALP